MWLHAALSVRERAASRPWPPLSVRWVIRPAIYRGRMAEIQPAEPFGGDCARGAAAAERRAAAGISGKTSAARRNTLAGPSHRPVVGPLGVCVGPKQDNPKDGKDRSSRKLQPRLEATSGQVDLDVVRRAESSRLFAGQGPSDPWSIRAVRLSDLGDHSAGLDRRSRPRATSTPYFPLLIPESLLNKEASPSRNLRRRSPRHAWPAEKSWRKSWSCVRHQEATYHRGRCDPSWVHVENLPILITVGQRAMCAARRSRGRSSARE